MIQQLTKFDTTKHFFFKLLTSSSTSDDMSVGYGFQRRFSRFPYRRLQAITLFLCCNNLFSCFFSILNFKSNNTQWGYHMLAPTSSPVLRLFFNNRSLPIVITAFGVQKIELRQISFMLPVPPFWFGLCLVASWESESDFLATFTTRGWLWMGCTTLIKQISNSRRSWKMWWKFFWSYGWTCMLSGRLRGCAWEPA